MLASEIITIFRDQMDDNDADDPLWTDAEVLEYLNEAVLEFAEETHVIAEYENAINTLTITADDPWVPFSSFFIEFDRNAYLVSNEKRLSIVSKLSIEKYDSIDDDYGFRPIFGTNWLVKTGEPTHLLTDMAVHKFRAYPIPTANDSVKVSGKRIPLVEITDVASESPDIPDRFHRMLVDFMRFKAYLKEDAETYDVQLATRHQVLWQQRLVDAKRRIRKQRGSRPRLVRYSGI